jgi:glutamine amidotransferase
MIGIIDTGIGNIPSVLAALKKIEKEAILCSNKNQLDKIKKIILPGVGSFKAFNNKINEKNLFYPIQNIVKSGVPILGICLGFHALFEKSIEYGVFPGLNLAKGEVVKINNIKEGIKIPHIGWNSCKFNKESKLFNGLKINQIFISLILIPQ